MQGYILFLPILLGALSSVTLSVIGLFVVSSFAAGMILIAPFERPFSPLDVATFLGALQASYLAAGWMSTFLRAPR